MKTDIQDTSTTINGYEYAVLAGVKYAAPVAVLSVIGFVLIADTFWDTEKARMLIVFGGILILVGWVAALMYTFVTAFNTAMADLGSGSSSVSVSAEGQFGIGLEAICSILIIIVGARTESYDQAGHGQAYAALAFKEE